MENKALKTVAVASTLTTLLAGGLANTTTSAVNPGYGKPVSELKVVKPKHIEYVINGDTIHFTWDYGKSPAANATITFEYPKENIKYNVVTDAKGNISKKANNLKPGYVMTNVYYNDGSYLFRFNPSTVKDTTTTPKAEVKKETPVATDKKVETKTPTVDNKTEIKKDTTNEVNKDKKAEEKPKEVLSHYVVDSNGLPIMNGSIDFTDKETKAVYTVKTNDKGAFDGSLVKNLYNYDVAVYTKEKAKIADYKLLDSLGNEVKPKKPTKTFEKKPDPQKDTPAIPQETQENKKSNKEIVKEITGDKVKTDSLPNTSVNSIMYLSGLVSLISFAMLFRRRKYNK